MAKDKYFPQHNDYYAVLYLYSTTFDYKCPAGYCKEVFWKGEGGDSLLGEWTISYIQSINTPLIVILIRDSFKISCRNIAIYSKIFFIT